MIRFLVGIVVSLAAAAIGFLVAAAILDDFRLNASGFVVAVIVFAIATALLQPFVLRSAMRNARPLAGGVGLVTTFVGLVVTDLVSDGVDIEGVGTWLAATAIVWIATMLAAFIVPFVLVKAGIESARERRAD